MIWKISIGVGFFILTVIVVGYLLPEGSELRHEVKIQAKLDKVWSILADLEAVQKYNHTVAKAQYISAEKTGVGASRVCDLKEGGSVKEAIIAWEPNKAITMELVESPWPVTGMKWRTALTETGGVVTVSQSLTYKMKLGPIGRILNAAVMKAKMHSTIEQVFQNLKTYAEAR